MEEAKKKNAEEAFVPRAGEYALEQTTFHTFVMDKFEPSSGKLISLTDNLLDLATEIKSSVSPQLATGVHLTYRQSWQTQGVALGQLLHSLSLAPGEIVRIAIQESTQKLFSATSESASDKESLQNTTTHNRSVGEVTSALAREAQEGFSSMSSQSRSQSVGGNVGASLLGFFGAENTNSRSANQSVGVGYSASSGRRDLAASMNQSIRDRTQQLASSARGRHSSVVKEIGEDDKEIASTRIVANYNHMHTLNIQYYEMVQIYKTSLELTAVDKCLFVPIQSVDFTSKSVHLNPLIQAHLARVSLIPEVNPNSSYLVLPFAVDNSLNLPSPEYLGKSPRVFPQVFKNYYKDYLNKYSLINDMSFSESRNQSTFYFLGDTGKRRVKGIKFFDGMLSANEMRNRLSRPVHTQIRFGKAVDMLMPEDRDEYKILFLRKAGSTTLKTEFYFDQADNQKNFLLEDIDFISMTFYDIRSMAGNGFFTPSMLFVLENNEAIFLPGYFVPGNGGVSLDIFIKKNGPENFFDSQLQHFHMHRNYYNYMLYKNLSATKMAAILSRYSYQDKPLLSQVDPAPIDVMGDYLVFRMGTVCATLKNITALNDQIKSVKKVSAPEKKKEKKSSQSKNDKTTTVTLPAVVEKSVVAAVPRPMEEKFTTVEEWLIKWMSEHGFYFGSVQKDDFVALPTGGIHAEGVLGVSNCAEKLDITRFTQWHESPIPILPPEIQKLTMGVRSQPVDLRPVQFSNRKLHMASPTTLPDPTGIQSTIKALMTSNLFRDMSAQQEVAELVKASSVAAGENERQAATQATKNYSTLANAQLEAVQAIASAVSQSQVDSSPSRVGARVNYARQLDERSSAARDDASETFREAARGGQAHYKLASALRPPAFFRPPTSNEERAFGNALYGPASSVFVPLQDHGLFANFESEKYRHVAEEYKQRFLVKFKEILSNTEIIVPFKLALKASAKLEKEISEEELIKFIKDNAKKVGLNGEEVIKGLGEIAKPLKKFVMAIGVAITIAIKTDLSREEVLGVIFKLAADALTSKAVDMIALAIAAFLLPETLVGAFALGLAVVIEGIFEAPNLNVGEEQELRQRRQEDAQKRQDDFMREQGRQPEDVPPVQSEAEDMLRRNSMKMGGKGK